MVSLLWEECGSSDGLFFSLFFLLLLFLHASNISELTKPLHTAKRELYCTIKCCTLLYCTVLSSPRHPSHEVNVPYSHFPHVSSCNPDHHFHLPFHMSILVQRLGVTSWTSPDWTEWWVYWLSYIVTCSHGSCEWGVSTVWEVYVAVSFVWEDMWICFIVETTYVKHTGEEPHKCKDCFKTLSQYENLKTHMRIYTAEKTHACKSCQQTIWQPEDSHEDSHWRDASFFVRIVTKHSLYLVAWRHTW